MYASVVYRPYETVSSAKAGVVICFSLNPSNYEGISPMVETP